VGHDGQGVKTDRRALEGLEFWKMTGSGNDFVFFDLRERRVPELDRSEIIQAICHRRNGVGADGIVLLLRSAGPGGLAIRYYNADGSLASLCGNATLCATRLALSLESSGPPEITIDTDAGVVRGRLAGRDPEIDLQPLTRIQPQYAAELAAGELRIGFAEAGVPHLVVLVEDVDGVPLDARGRQLRHHAGLEAGANVNFVARAGSRWLMRTYERGVEGETLACGTGAVASAALVQQWGLAGPTVEIRTRSGRDVVVRLQREGERTHASLAGEGRVVFHGRIARLSLGNDD
jgi:diaminopimelate epimerase